LTSTSEVSFFTKKLFPEPVSPRTRTMLPSRTMGKSLSSILQRIAKTKDTSLLPSVLTFHGVFFFDPAQKRKIGGSRLGQARCRAHCLLFASARLHAWKGRLVVYCIGANTPLKRHQRRNASKPSAKLVALPKLGY
jgi:hypothetical protein